MKLFRTGPPSPSMGPSGLSAGIVALSLVFLFVFQGTARANMGFGRGFAEVFLAIMIVYLGAINLVVETVFSSLCVKVMRLRLLDVVSLMLVNLVSFPVFFLGALWLFSKFGSSTLQFQLSLLPLEIAVVVAEGAGVFGFGKWFKTGITLRKAMLFCLFSNTASYFVGVLLSAVFHHP